jgi:hypothetical protein
MLTTSEWTAIAGALFTGGGFLWGRGFGAGAMKKQLENATSTLGLLQEEIEMMRKNFQDCRFQAAQNITKAQASIDGVQIDVDRIANVENEHFSEFLNHMSRRDVHTDSEWRATMLGRLDSLASSFETRLLSFEKVILDKIGGLERAVKNGNGGGKS